MNKFLKVMWELNTYILNHFIKNVQLKGGQIKNEYSITFFKLPLR